MAELTGKVALVTGGTRGIGAATAQVLAAAGARVVVTHRDSAIGAAETVQSLAGDGHRAIPGVRGGHGRFVRCCRVGR